MPTPSRSPATQAMDLARTAAIRLGQAQSAPRDFEIVVTLKNGQEVTGTITNMRIDRKTPHDAPSNLIATVGGREFRVEDVRAVESVKDRERARQR